MNEYKVIEKLNKLYKITVNAKTPQSLNLEAVKELGALIKAVLNIINRQQAEIKKLRNSQVVHIDINEQFQKECEHERKEAIKEFAKRLKAKANYEEIWTGEEEYVFHTVEFDDIDELVKEMVGES